MKSHNIVLTFDDSSRENIKVAKILERYGSRGVFFLTTKYVEKEDALNIATFHEIGSHTHTHPRLDDLSVEAASSELTLSKKLLEEMSNSNIISFSYPYGRLNGQIKYLVKSAGYCFARTALVVPPYREIRDHYGIPVCLIDTQMTRKSYIYRVLKSLIDIDESNLKALPLYWKLGRGSPYRAMLDLARILSDQLDRRICAQMFVTIMHPSLIERYNAFQEFEEVVNLLSNVGEVRTFRDIQRATHTFGSNTAT